MTTTTMTVARADQMGISSMRYSDSTLPPGRGRSLVVMFPLVVVRPIRADTSVLGEIVALTIVRQIGLRRPNKQHVMLLTMNRL